MKPEINPVYRACAVGLMLGTAVLALQQSVAAATLIHRYSFNGTNDGAGNLGVSVADSVGGSAWNGILPNGGDFETTTNQLALQSASLQYVEFPSGLITNHTALTVDTWATLNGNAFGFLWTFGNTVDGNGGNCIFLQPANARLCVAGTQPSWGGEQNAGFPSLANSTVHLTSVIDPPTGRLLVYTNGSLAGKFTALSWGISNVFDIHNYIAKSLFDADGYVDVVIDEFRIWDGALNGLEIAGSDVAGPDNTTPAPITVTNITVTVSVTNIPQGGRVFAEVTGLATTFTNPVSIDARFCTFTSANTNILKVDTNGMITALRPGSSSITARYVDSSNSVNLTVFQPETVLKHRYSFSDADDGSGNINGAIADSIGGTQWNGTMPNGGDLASIPGQVVLSSGAAQYVQFPSGIITNYTALTVDMWATLPTFFDGNCFLWAFGDSLGGDLHGAYYVFAQPSQGRVAISGFDPGWAGPEQNATGAGNLTGRTNVHLTAVINPAVGVMSLYTNGVLAGENLNVTWQLSTIHDVLNYIAKSLYNADAYVDVNVDEYRIYDGALTAAEVAQSQAMGPNVVSLPTLSVAIAGGNAVLSWSTNHTGFQLLSTTAITGPVWNPVAAAPVISGTKYQVTVPATNTSQFFRLSK